MAAKDIVAPCRIKGARIDLFVIYWVHAPPPACSPE